MKIKASELVCDYDLYPRTQIDSIHTRQIRDALEAGESLPPIVADKATHRVVDGFHRLRALMALYGGDVEIEIDEREYESDAEIFADALRFNARHGRVLSPFDRSRAVSHGVQLGLSVEAVAKALALRVDRAQEIKLERAGKTAKGASITLKSTVKHLVGKNLSKRQISANDKAGGMQASYYVNQVINLVEGDALDLSNDYLVKRLGVLSRALKTLELETVVV